MPKKKIKENPCIKCDAPCCHDLSIPLTKPKTKHDIDKYFWYLHFKGVHIYINHHHWYLLFKSRCRFLAPKTNLCTKYEQREDVCRNHKSDSCEITGSWYDHMLSSPDDLMKHLKKIPPKKKTKKTVSKKKK